MLGAHKSCEISETVQDRTKVTIADGTNLLIEYTHEAA